MQQKRFTNFDNINILLRLEINIFENQFILKWDLRAV